MFKLKQTEIIYARQKPQEYITRPRIDNPTF